MNGEKQAAISSTESQTSFDDNKISFKAYSAALKSEIVALFPRVPFKNAIWDWEFNENPYSHRFEPVVLVDASGNVIGFNGVLPVRVQYDNHEVDALWSCDFMVKSGLRGHGCGSRMKTRLKQAGSLIMVLGVSETAALVLKKMGWSRGDQVRVFQRTRDFRSPKALLRGSLQLLNYLARTSSRNSAGKYVVRDMGSLPPPKVLNELWQTVAPGYGKAVVRDHAYLSWKYENHPLGTYRFLCLCEGETVCSVGVYRINDGLARLVDYVGPAQDAKHKAALVAAFCDVTKRAAHATCTTSDEELGNALLAHGFRPARSRPGFFVWDASGNKSAHLGWFIMGGDSDGDMLAASRDNWTSQNRFASKERGGETLERVGGSTPVNVPNQKALRPLSSELQVERLSAKDFSNMQEDWDVLMAQSVADPLFMGWRWLHNWWLTWGDRESRELYLLGAYDRDGSLVGLAPLYRDTVKWRDWMSIKQLQWVGNSWRTGGTVRTEYVDFITASALHSHVVRAFLNHVFADSHWDEFIFRDISGSSETWAFLNSVTSPSADCLLRCASEEPGMCINTTGSYNDYLMSLGKHTRLRLHNRRKRLESLGKIELRFIARDSIDTFFRTLNRLHRVRWGTDCFDGASLKFHLKLAHEMAALGQLRASIIFLNGEAISALYNVIAGRREYNIQAGFDDTIGHGLSLGMLHLGYVLQRAFADLMIEEFDLLAGFGKKTFYKGHFGGKQSLFLTAQVVRPAHLRIAYSIYDKAFG